MSSYLELFQDFLQKKDVGGGQGALSHPSEDEDPDEDMEPATVFTVVPKFNACPREKKMEHSYIRDCARPKYELITGLSPARTILVRRPPQCPSCHINPLEESELEDGNQVPVPTFNEIAAKEAMCECARIAKYVKNTNSDDDDWETRINKNGWTNMQKSLFMKIVRILDYDHLGRLANAGRQNETMQRRVIVDKSAKCMRKVLASIAWDSRLTQWLHCLLMECLPSTYMASYLDILQTLKTKLPTLMDKMLFGRPMNFSQELLAPVMKRKWEPILTATKSRKLNHNAVIIALPPMPASGPIAPRMQKWYQHLASITQVVQISLPMTGNPVLRQPLDQVAEQIVSLTRVKILEMRNENPTRNIILIGFNAGSALALQVAMSENISCVVCMGFAYNTLNGVRGMPDDRILDIKVPVLFVIGQNSARTSPEEMEALREKMQSESSLVVVGSADDVLRIPKSRRKLENVTQSMVDSMIVDEVFEFTQKVLNNPPGPRVPTLVTSGGGTGFVKVHKNSTQAGISDGPKTTPIQRKRKLDAQQVGGAEEATVPTKAKGGIAIGRPRTRPGPTAGATTTPNRSIGGTVKAGQLVTTSTPVGAAKLPQSMKQQKTTAPSTKSITNEDLNLAIQSILSDTNEHNSSLNTIGGSIDASKKMVTNYELMAHSKSTPIKTALMNPPKLIATGGGTPAIGSKIKMIPANQFVQLKPPMQSQSKIYTIKTTNMLNGGGSNNVATVTGASNATAGTTINIGSIVTAATATTAAAVTANVGQQQQIFTLKSPNGQTTQFVTAAASAKPKYKVVKPITTVAADSSSSSSCSNNLDLSNIIDMPIVFADSEGNISDTVSTASDASRTNTPTTRKSNSSGVGQLIISQQIIKEANVPSAASSGSGVSLASSPYAFKNKHQLPNAAAATTTAGATTAAAKTNKVVFINRNTMKPCPNIISRSNVAQQLPKYTKVVVTNPKTAATTLVQRASTQSSGASLVSSVKQLNLQTLKVPPAAAAQSLTSPAANLLSGAKQIQLLNSSTTTGGGSTASSSADKPSSGMQVRNIMVKPGGLKQIPPHLKTQLLNCNLTVRKLVSIVPTAVKTTTTTSSVSTCSNISQQQQDGANSCSTMIVANTTIQTSPKIITLNPINPSAGTTPAVTTVVATSQSNSHE